MSGGNIERPDSFRSCYISAIFANYPQLYLTVKRIERDGILTIGDLADFHSREIFEKYNISQKNQEIIIYLLAQMGLNFQGPMLSSPANAFAEDDRT